MSTVRDQPAAAVVDVWEGYDEVEVHRVGPDQWQALATNLRDRTYVAETGSSPDAVMTSLRLELMARRLADRLGARDVQGQARMASPTGPKNEGEP